MASANVDMVRSLFAAWERGDYSSTEWANLKIEVVLADGRSPGTWTGLAGMAEAFRDATNVWAMYRSEAEEYRELDDESVLVLAASAGAARRADSSSGRRECSCSKSARAR